MKGIKTHLKGEIEMRYNANKGEITRIKAKVKCEITPNKGEYRESQM